VNTEFARILAEAVGLEQLVFGVDTKEGRVAVKGWKEQVALTPEEAIPQLESYCGAFLYTHIDREGTMQGFPIEVAQGLKQMTKRQLIVAGGIREQAEIDALDAIGVDAVAGMAVYSGVLST
jgi:phosphoribosylformimino-5-aminoimidazole carboxamide ribotide isomerase